MALNGAFNGSSPEDKSGTGRSSFSASMAQAERLLQIAFVLPCAMLIGWGAGWWIDHHFHTRWATLTGLVFGIVAGMVSAIRLALAAGAKPPASKGRL
jgi:ATP synthase protein I